jgi:hypothetical protein
VILLNLLWWLGWAWFVAWTALPLVLLPELGPLAGGLAWAVLAPWSSLFGVATVHRLLPKGASGRHQMFADPGSVQWALKGWAPGLYLTVFQPVFFLSPAFQRVALGAFQARLGAGATVTSRTVLREPHRVRIGRGSVIGEFAHLVTSYQPRPHVLIVGGLGDVLSNETAFRTAAKIASDISEMVEMSRARGAKAYVLTLPPWGGMNAYNAERAKITLDVSGKPSCHAPLDVN